MTASTFDADLVAASTDTDWVRRHHDFALAVEEYAANMWTGQRYACEERPCGECLSCASGETASCEGCGRCFGCGVSHSLDSVLALASDRGLLIQSRRIRDRRDSLRQGGPS